MTLAPQKLVILGAGPAGAGAAYKLMRQGFTGVTVLEQQQTAGGNTGSFDLEGLPVDYGSHRLHPACDPGILDDLRELLGPDLLNRPRHGRIYFRERWIHFPLKPADLLWHLPASFAAGVFRDLALKPFRARADVSGTFASVLESGLGRTMCREFYFPYARKLWGLSPEELSAVQARRRISGNSPARILYKLISAVPGLRPAMAGSFFYPRRGFGQICRRLYEAARDAGADFQFGARVAAVQTSDKRVSSVQFERAGRLFSIPTENVWSTLPFNQLVFSLKPAAPPAVLEAASALSFRGMILIYLVLEQDQFSEYDAHYFPGLTIPVSRISEPKNYSAARESRGWTVLCAELPCAVGSAHWRMSDQELGELIRCCLETARIPIRAPVRNVVTRRLSHAYPIYQRGYEKHFDTIDRWSEEFHGLLTFGRQGLFAHDNTHHSLFMAYAAVNCLGADGKFDRERWHSHRMVFDTHIVED